MKLPRLSRSLARGFSRTALWQATISGSALALAGCTEPPPVVLDPTPAPTTVIYGDYRLTHLIVSPPGVGLDLDADATTDNNFPYLLDDLYAFLEAAAVPLLEEQFGPAMAQQLWTVISVTLNSAGLPISAEAYNQAVAEAIQNGDLNYLPTVSSNAGTVSAVFFAGLATPVGYQRLSGDIGVLEGTGSPDANLGPGELLLLYPGLFELTLLEAYAQFAWDSGGLDGRVLAGAIPTGDVVNTLLNLIPESIEIDGEEVPIPSELITLLAVELTNLLEEAVVQETNEPLFDLTLQGSRSTAISAGLTFAGTVVHIAE